MKHKYLLGAMFTLMLLLPIMSVTAFWHPEEEPDPDPECTYFGLLIEGVGTTSTERFNFTEPEYGYCTDVTVEVWICNVEDLYGYKFTVSWNTAFFTLESWVVEDPGWGGDFYCVRPLATYAGAPWYEQACVAYNPATGLPPGNYKLATLTFHIYNDACWCWDTDEEGYFGIHDYEARDSCTGLIKTCTHKYGYWRYIPMQPKIWKEPAEEVNCKLPGSFVETIMVDDIVKMRSLCFNQTWDKYFAPYLGWRDIITTTVDDIEINQAVFPEDNATTYTISVGSQYVKIEIKMDSAYPLINITEPTWVVKITFTKHDPWYCGGQPQYTVDLETHEITVENVSTPLRFYKGCFDVECPDLCYICFGDYYGDHTGDRDYAIYTNAKYTFDPVPGDLTGDGVVDLDDLMIIAGLYCLPTGFTFPYSPHPAFPAYPAAFWLYYYDFTDDGHIGLEDLIVIGKNIGRTC